jgi:hypothetical protein
MGYYGIVEWVTSEFVKTTQIYAKVVDEKKKKQHMQ